MSNREENIILIEAYFNNELKPAERNDFDQRCIDDESFARDVAMFVATEEGIRQQLLQQKKESWKQLSQPGNNVLRMTTKRWIPYAAAACLVLAVSIYFIQRPASPRAMAAQYTREHFSLLSQTMNASQDSLQQGIAAYNSQDYAKALAIFRKLAAVNPGNAVARKNIGLVYLVTKDYDNALQQFSEMSLNRNLYKNQGLFLTAVTLLQRNKEGDEAAARRLLEIIVKQGGEGQQEAREWLERW